MCMATKSIKEYSQIPEIFRTTIQRNVYRIDHLLTTHLTILSAWPHTVLQECAQIQYARVHAHTHAHSPYNPNPPRFFCMLSKHSFWFGSDRVPTPVAASFSVNFQSWRVVLVQWLRVIGEGSPAIYTASYKSRMSAYI